MAEFEDKLNEILSNPGAMSQIMQLAQSLGGASSGAENGVSGGVQPPSSNPSPPPSSPPPSGGNPLSALTGGLDPQMLTRLLPLVQELGGQQDSNARALLLALRPYLKPERQEKVERAIQLARLFHIGKSFLAGWGK